MRRLIRIGLAMAVAGIAFGLPGAAEAASVTFNFSEHINETPTDFSLPVKVQKFDPSLGTLQSVEIVYTSKIKANMTVSNVGDNRAIGTVDTEVILGLTDPKSHIVQLNNISTMPESFSLAKNATKQFPSASGTDKAQGTSDVTYSTQKILNEFTGMDKITLAVSTLTIPQVTLTQGSVTSSTSATATADGFVIYTYAAVPEPSSLVLGAIGTLGVLAFGVRTRSRSAMS